LLGSRTKSADLQVHVLANLQSSLNSENLADREDVRDGFDGLTGADHFGLGRVHPHSSD
jgi:hypothetical protein